MVFLVSNQELFDQFFGTNQRDGEVVLNSTERSVAQLIYTLASSRIREDFGEESSDYTNDEPDDDPNDEPDDDPNDEPDDDPNDEPGDDDDDGDDNEDVESESFDEPMQAAMVNFNKVVELFKLSRSAKVAFLQNFDHWSSLRKNNIQRLKEIADEIHGDKFKSDIAKVVGRSIGGILTSLSLIPILAPVTLPLAITAGIAGGGVVVGSTVTAIVLLKKKLEEAKTHAEKDEEDFSAMKKWFIHTEELQEALQKLIAYDLLNEMSEDLERFNDEVQENLDSAKDKFRDLLIECIGKMCKKSKIVELFGVVFAPVVMTFVFVVCLMRDHNRMALECIAEVARLAVNFLSGVGTGVNAGRLAGRTAVVVTTSIFIAIGVVFDVVNVVWSSIDIYNRTEPEQAMQIRKAAEGLEKEFSFIEEVYEELQKWESIDRSGVTEWKTFVVNHVPDDALQIDIKMAVKPHLSEEAWGCIRLQRYSMDGNRWLVKIPASHSQMRLRQSHLTIKTESCQVKQWTQWQTFVVHNIPDDAEQEDIRMGVRSHLPEEAWGSIKLQRLSTVGNNWIVKVPSRHSQNLRQQSRIIVKGERCSVMQ